MYKGQLEGFPKEVVEWMLDQQVAQGNKRDVTVFEDHVDAGKRNGGFDWDLMFAWNGVPEINFCNKVIWQKDFDLFYQRFPKKQPEKTFPRVMLVWNFKGEKPIPRVVFAYKRNKYIAWAAATTIEEAENYISTFPWRHAKEINEHPNIEITVRINGKEAKLSDISEETLREIREF